jgi:hypothetical protein
MNEKTKIVGMPKGMFAALVSDYGEFSEAEISKIKKSLPAPNAKERRALELYLATKIKAGAKARRGFDIEAAANELKRKSILGKLAILQRTLPFCDNIQGAKARLKMRLLLADLEAIPKS